MQGGEIRNLDVKERSSIVSLPMSPGLAQAHPLGCETGSMRVSLDWPLLLAFDIWRVGEKAHAWVKAGTCPADVTCSRVPATLDPELANGHTSDVYPR